MHTPDRLSDIGQRVGIGLDVIPLVRLGPSTDDDHVGLAAQLIGLRTVMFEVHDRGEADALEDWLRLIVGEVRQHRQFGEEQRPMQTVELTDC